VTTPFSFFEAPRVEAPHDQNIHSSASVRRYYTYPKAITRQFRKKKENG
jgi:hypothetical protein